MLPEYFRYLRDPQSSLFSCGADTVLSHPRNVGRLLHSGRVGMVSIRGLNSGPDIFLQTRSLGNSKWDLKGTKVLVWLQGNVTV